MRRFVAFSVATWKRHALPPQIIPKYFNYTSVVHSNAVSISYQAMIDLLQIILNPVRFKLNVSTPQLSYRRVYHASRQHISLPSLSLVEQPDRALQDALVHSKPCTHELASAGGNSSIPVFSGILLSHRYSRERSICRGFDLICICIQ